MKKVVGIIAWMLIAGTALSQTPQHVTNSSEDKGSIWESTTGVIIFIAFVIVMIGGRTLSKRIHKKRDEAIEKKEN